MNKNVYYIKRIFVGYFTDNIKLRKNIKFTHYQK